MITRDYEALVILKTAGTEPEIAKHAAGLEEQIRKAGGTVGTSQGMGRRRLAFRIARQAEGYYYLLRFQAPTERIGELERTFRLNDTIVRFMILSADEAALPAAPTPGSASGAAQAGPLTQPAASARSV